MAINDIFSIENISKKFNEKKLQGQFPIHPFDKITPGISRDTIEQTQPVIPEIKQPKKPGLLTKLGTSLINNQFSKDEQKNIVKNMDSGIGRFLVKTGSGILLDYPQEKMKELGMTSLENRKFNEDFVGASADFVSSNLGWLVPYTGAARVLRATGLGAKLLPKLAKTAPKSEKITNLTKNALQLGKEGALASAILSPAEIAIRESVNPEMYTAKDNLTKFGYDVGLGFIADPVIELGGGAILKSIAKNYRKLRGKPSVSDLIEEGKIPSKGTLAEPSKTMTIQQKQGIFKKEDYQDDLDLINEEEKLFDLGSQNNPYLFTKIPVEQLTNDEISNFFNSITINKEAKAIEITRIEAEFVKKTNDVVFSELPEKDKLNRFNKIRGEASSQQREILQGDFLFEIPGGLQKIELNNKISKFKKENQGVDVDLYISQQKNNLSDFVRGNTPEYTAPVPTIKEKATVPTIEKPKKNIVEVPVSSKRPDSEFDFALSEAKKNYLSSYPHLSINKITELIDMDLKFNQEQKKYRNSLSKIMDKLTLNKQLRDKEIKYAEQKRKFIQDDLLTPVEGGLNKKELQELTKDILKKDDFVLYKGQIARVMQVNKKTIKVVFLNVGEGGKYSKQKFSNIPKEELTKTTEPKMKKSKKSSESTTISSREISEERTASDYDSMDTDIINSYTDEQLEGIQKIQDFADSLTQEIQKIESVQQKFSNLEIRNADAIELNQRLLGLKESINTEKNNVARKIRNSENNLNSMPLNLYVNYIKFGVLHILDNGLDFAIFSKDMIQKFGTKIEPYLKTLYKLSKKEISSRYNADAQGIDFLLDQSSRLRIQKELKSLGVIDKNQAISGFAEQIRYSGKLTEDEVKGIPLVIYNKLSNKDLVDEVNNILEKGDDFAYNIANSTGNYNPVKVLTAYLLSERLGRKSSSLRLAGKIEEAKVLEQKTADLIEKISTEATVAGQANQAISLVNSLTVEGQIIRLKKKLENYNEEILNDRIFKRKATILTDKDLTDLRYSLQIQKDMLGYKDIGNKIINDLEDIKNKTTEQLSPEQIQSLLKLNNELLETQNIFSEILDTNKFKIEQSQKLLTSEDNKVLSGLKDFFSKKEEEAIKRIKSNKNIISSTPLDIYVDYVIVGTSKLLKGTINFTNWSKEMISEFGEKISPFLLDIFKKSQEVRTLKVRQKLMFNKTEVSKLIEKIIKEKNISIEDSKILRQLAEEISNLSGDIRKQALEDLELTVKSKIKPSFLRRVASAQTILQLANPKTQVRNILGNELLYRLERLSKYVATPIDIINSNLTGKERTISFKTYAQGEFWKNFIVGAKAGWKGVSPQSGLETQFDIGSSSFYDAKKSPLIIFKYLEKSLGATLRGFDYAAYKRAYTETLGELAVVNLKTRKLPITKENVQNFMRNADNNVIQIADDYGKYVTFQDDNLFSRKLVDIKKFLNLNKEFGAGEIIIKYPKTPGALLMRSLEYSPAGIIKGLYSWSKAVSKNPTKYTIRNSILDITRGIVGTTGLTALGYFALRIGLITASSNENINVQELQKQSGLGNYRLNLTALKRFVESGFNPNEAKLQKNDLMVSYDWAQPLAISIALGASAAQSSTEKQNILNTSKRIYQSSLDALSGGIQSLTEQSVLQGISSFISVYPGQTFLEKLKDTALSAPTTFLPTMLNQFRQISDNSQRETYDPNELKQVSNKIKNRIPIVSKFLPEKYDSLGMLKEVVQDGSKKPLKSILNVFLNPSFTTRYKPSQQAEYLFNALEKTGETKIIPKTFKQSQYKQIDIPIKKIKNLDDSYIGREVKIDNDLATIKSVNGILVTVIYPNGKEKTFQKRKIDFLNQKLTTKEFSNFQKNTGEFISKEILKLSKSRNLSDKAEIKRLEKILKEAQDNAEKLIVKDIIKNK